MLRAIEHPGWILALLGRLTARHETARAAPWSVQDAPADFLDTLLKAIVGIEISLERLQGKWKLSQNRPPADQAAVAADTGAALAALMGAGSTR